MLRVSLWFAAVGLVCLTLADIEVTTLHPWQELRRLLAGALAPDLPVLYTFRSALLNTVTFAFCGIVLSVVLGALLSFALHFRVVRLGCAFIRAIHEIFWAFIFLPIVGLNPICGVLAIAIPYAGTFAKVYAEIRQEADQQPSNGLPPDSGPLSRFLYGVLPVIYQDLKNYTSYRFECALRSSAILGFIGLPTLGFHLETAFREGLYSEAAVLLYCFYLLIASLRLWLRPKVVLVCVPVFLALLSKEISLSWQNVTRFLTYEILPWPMRREGVLSGTYEVTFPDARVWDWAVHIITAEALPGIWNTVVLTQIVLVATGVFTLLIFPAICRHFMSVPVTRLFHLGLIVLRTTPEYILAYIFVQLWGPSMLPAVCAIVLHNGAILSYITGRSAGLIRLRMDAPRGRINRYSFEVLPRVYSQFLAFLFYRWEVMMRESAILGILGIYTLGFHIDSAIDDDKLDKAIFLIVVTALLNMGIDTISQRVRQRLRLSSGTVLTVGERPTG